MIQIGPKILSVRDSPINGSGLFLDMSFEKGKAIFGCHEVGLFALINHSCSPNCLVYHHWICADGNLNPGDELTIDYTKIPFRCSPLEFDCQCGSPDCRGHIKL